jgi:hypothetical protein
MGAMQLRRDDLLDAGLASLAAGVHLAMAGLVGRFPPPPDVSLLFVALPAVAAAAAALALLVAAERRVLQVACVYTWLMAAFTLPAYGLGLAWVPSAVVLTVAVVRPRLSSGPAASG